MRRSPFLAAFATALLVTLACPAGAQAPPGSATQEPAVRQTQQPEITPQGRAPPQNHTAPTGLALQQAIDAAHRNSTGITREQGTRSPGDQPEGLRDGEAPRLSVAP